MITLLSTEQTTYQFFQNFIFEKGVEIKDKEEIVGTLKSDDFFRVLKEKGIRKKSKEHSNLKKFMQLNEENPDLLMVKKIKKTLEQMADDENFMEAI